MKDPHIKEHRPNLCQLCYLLVLSDIHRTKKKQREKYIGHEYKEIIRPFSHKWCFSVLSIYIIIDLHKIPISFDVSTIITQLCLIYPQTCLPIKIMQINKLCRLQNYIWQPPNVKQIYHQITFDAFCFNLYIFSYIEQNIYENVSCLIRKTLLTWLA